MPRDKVEWRMLLCVLEELARELVDNVPLFSGIFIPGHWDLKVSCISQAIGPNRSQIRNLEVALIYLTYVASGLFPNEFYSKSDPSWNHNDLLRFNSYSSKLCFEQQ